LARLAAELIGKRNRVGRDTEQQGSGRNGDASGSLDVGGGEFHCGS
jgi:hypothetical protein